VSTSDKDLEYLLEHLRRTRGFDFTGYKRASLARRVTKRLQTAEVASYADYVDYLEVHPEEFASLFNTVLINVTNFFRDPGAWEYLAESVLPDLIARCRPNFPIRVWSAGCASGEEAYSLAMLFAEALGADSFNEKVKIYATDADEEALAKARLAVYSAREVADVPPAMLEKYFEKSQDNYVFRKELRRHVIFGRHDLIQDAPISRVDMLVCRNTLMYFNAETQAKILSRFQFALSDHGILFLGRAETLMTHATAFSAVDVKRRISTKLPNQPSSVRERLLQLAHNGHSAAEAPTNSPEVALREAALDAVPTPQLIVDLEGLVVTVNERARGLFGISRSEVGRPLQDLKISYRPVELRAAIDKVYGDRHAVTLRDVEWNVAGDVRWFDVHVIPLVDQIGATLGASVAFVDITTPKRLQGDLEHANQELETAYEELQSTNEELETTNEELQSTVEELETTNEELQSTNEELETMNEELQSTNEELQAMNDELRIRGGELNQVNGFLESILTSLRGAVVVVDSDSRVLVWNQGAEELWGLREPEVHGKHILGLDIGLPVERLKHPIRECLAGNAELIEMSIEAVNRRGRGVSCDIHISPLITRAREIVGAIIVMDAVGISQPTLTVEEREPVGSGLAVRKVLKSSRPT
jgi:two-component system, chemotaxis family, CheB/CheR fusion protein